MHCVISLPQPAKVYKSCLQLEDAMFQKLFIFPYGIWEGREILRFNIEGCKDFFELYSHCRTANDIFTVFFVKRTIFELLPLYLNVYHPLVNYYWTICDYFFRMSC
uniref:Uncharacterized protein n=2 Tax=Anatinae TaxID=2068716 RepID=A0A8B9U6I5_9AVES